MDLSRRDFLRLSGGAAAFALVSGLGLLRPRRADAIAGIDDATLGALVFILATLGGYAVSRTVANTTLDAMGYGFSDFVQDTGHQAEAVTKAIADANNLGVQIERQQAEDAAQAIAAGTGYFGEAMATAAQSGRVGLDGLISGVGALPAVLRSLSSGFVTGVMRPVPLAYPGITTFGSASAVCPYPLGCMSLDGILAYLASLGVDNSGLPTGYSSGVLRLFKTMPPAGGAVGSLVLLNPPVSMQISPSSSSPSVTFRMSGSGNSVSASIRYNGKLYYEGLSNSSSFGFTINMLNYDMLVSSDIVSGSLLPGVDRAIDAPDVISPAYDSLPLGHDLVIDPTTDEVVSAGTIGLPLSIPEVSGDYVGTYADILSEALAGVVPGVISLPVPISTPVTVGTVEGVASMPIADAIVTDTSLAQSGEIVVPPPVSPITPPVSVPDGPWVPGVTLPFEQVWPFNMIYDMTKLFRDLGQ